MSRKRTVLIPIDPEASRCSVLKARDARVRPLITSLDSLVMDTVDGSVELMEPKNGEPMRWTQAGHPSRPVVAKAPILATQPDAFEDFRGELQAAIRDRQLEAGSFDSGIPIVFLDGTTDPDPAATIAYWNNDGPIPEYEKRAEAYRHANPYVRMVANALAAGIREAQQAGHWVDTMSPIIRESASDSLWQVQLVLPWRVEATEHRSNPDGSQFEVIRVSPVMPLIGFDMGSLRTLDPFNDPINEMAMAFKYEFTLDTPRYDDLLKSEEDTLTGATLLQFIHGGHTRWEMFESDNDIVTFVQSQPPAGVHNQWSRTEGWTIPDEPNYAEVLFTIGDQDFIGDGFDPMYRERINKAKRYGKPMTFFRPLNDFMGCEGEMFPNTEMLNAYVLNEYAQNAITPNPLDDEWGESSRFIPSWKDKRGVKVIDRAKGSDPYWSDVIRCRICNGQVRVLLKERPITFIFDCPHCGESGCIDCTHCQPDVAWPDDRKRKQVELR